MWRAKQKASYEASGEVPARLRISHEDKGKMPLNINGLATASCDAKPMSLSSPNSEALAPSANLTPTSEVANGVANIAPVPKGTNRFLAA